MVPTLAASIFKILNPGGAATGTGVLVAPTLAVTCAHVVQAAGSAPGGRLEMACCAPPQKSGEPDKTVQGWVLEAGWSGPDLDDLAFVSLENPPEGLVPLDLAGHLVGRQVLGLPQEGPGRNRLNRARAGGAPPFARLPRAPLSPRPNLPPSRSPTSSSDRHGLRAERAP